MLNIEKIFSSGKTVFTIWDLKKILWLENNYSIRNYLSKQWKKEILNNLYYWIWAFKKYNLFELATKLRKNSYISFETVLKKEWVIFQDYGNTIFLASDNTIQKETKDNKFKYLKVKDSILYNPLWIAHKWNYSIASKERAICDRLYLSKNYYFDNLENINFDKLEQISKIYNKRVILEVNKMIKDVK